MYEKLRESPKANEEIKELRKDEEIYQAINDIVNEALEEYITEQEQQKQILQDDASELDKKLQQQRILAYLGAGTTLCTTLLGVIATIAVAFSV